MCKVVQKWYCGVVVEKKESIKTNCLLLCGKVSSNLAKRQQAGDKESERRKVNAKTIRYLFTYSSVPY